jgi:hypothetical protein
MLPYIPLDIVNIILNLADLPIDSRVAFKIKPKPLIRSKELDKNLEKILKSKNSALQCYKVFNITRIYLYKINARIWIMDDQVTFNYKHGKAVDMHTGMESIQGNLLD